MREKVATLLKNRASLLQALASLAPLGLGEPIGGNNANFILVPVLNRATGVPDNERSQSVYVTMAETEKVVVRFRGKEVGCSGCLRITVGSEQENKIVVEKLAQVLQRI